MEKITIFLRPYNAGEETKEIVTGVLQKLGISADFSYQADGKPVLSSGYVSVSHSADAIAIAVSDFPVGIDFERIREVNYRSVLARLGEADCGLTDFFALWTRAESVFKVEGGSISTYKTSKLHTLTYVWSEYVLSVSSTETGISVDFLIDGALSPKIELLR